MTQLLMAQALSMIGVMCACLGGQTGVKYPFSGIALVFGGVLLASWGGWLLVTSQAP